MRAASLDESSTDVFRRNRPRAAALILATAFLFLSSSALVRAVPPGAGRPFRVVDKNGALVGYTVSENVVAREINGIWVTFYVHTGLGIFDSNAIYVYYTTADCSGTSYIPHYSTFSEGTRVGPRLYYPLDNQILNPQSVRLAYGSGEEGPCYQASNVSGVYGAAASVNVDTFGLELPFRAIQ